MGFNGIYGRYPLVNVYMWRTGKIHHAINGKTHYFYGLFNRYVSLPEGISNYVLYLYRFIQCPGTLRCDPGIG